MNKIIYTVKKEFGITLVALVITIIILLILSGITLNTMLSQNGLLNNVEKAKTEDNKQTASETMQFKITSLQIKNYTQKQQLLTLQELADGLCEDNEIEYVQLESQSIASLNKIDVGNSKSIFTKIKQYPYEFEINSSLQLASIDGIKLSTSNTDNNGEINKLKDEIDKIKKEFNDYKNAVANILTQNGIETTTETSKETIVENIKKIANDNFLKGVNSKFKMIKENVSSKYIQTINVTDLEGWQNFTIDNFVIVNKRLIYDNEKSVENPLILTKSYDSQTGVLTLSKQRSYSNDGWVFYNLYDVYVFE